MGWTELTKLNDRLVSRGEGAKVLKKNFLFESGMNVRRLQLFTGTNVVGNMRRVRVATVLAINF